MYRALFVHSMGFLQTIREIVSGIEDGLDQNARGKRDFMQVNVWKVYQILLEYCCITDYRMLLTKQQIEHDELTRSKNAEILILQTG